MEKDIRKIWRALCPIRKLHFRGNQGSRRGVCTPGGELIASSTESLPAKGASKSELLDAVDDLIGEETEYCGGNSSPPRHFMERKSHFHSRVAQCVQRFGWTVENGQLQPSDFQVEGASMDFSEEVRQLLRTAYTRYGQDDYSGAMTAVCSALDNVREPDVRESRPRQPA